VEQIITSIDNAYFVAHSDLPGIVELVLPGQQSIKFTVAAAEDLQINLTINCKVARSFAKVMNEQR
jgi:hypothetical protein